MKFNAEAIKEKIMRIVGTLSTFLLAFAGLIGLDWLSPDLINLFSESLDHVIGLVFAAIGGVMVVIKEVREYFQKEDPQERKIRAIVQRQLSEAGK